MKVNWIKNFGAFLKGPGICQTCRQKCKEADPRVILCSEWKLIVLAFVLLFLLGACGFSNIKTILPVETKTKQGETVVETEIPRTADRDDIPAGWKPSDVRAEITTASGAKIYIPTDKKKPVAMNQQAIEEIKSGDLKVEQPKKSWKWLYITIGIIALLLAADFAMRRFLGFNPIALFFKFIGKILGKIFRRIN